MRIKDLPAPITASKADWLPGTAWLGFTPTNGDIGARNQCQSTIKKQFGNGYVVEYITEMFQKPNLGFENHPKYLTERADHEKHKGRLIAVHKLHTTSRKLETILGAEDFTRMQDMWAQEEKRFRWSVAFPIVESYKIKDDRKAKDVLGEEAYARIYAHASATLRPLTSKEQSILADLEIESVATSNAWIGIEDEFHLAERSEINPATEQSINRDLSALEGISLERLSKIKRRAAWIADKFIRERSKSEKLHCDNCAFDPRHIAMEIGAKPRSFLDVHHKNPLDEGVRYTTTADFSLLCPTCHRVEHVRMRLG
jgi:5-methylcytosine-specific restriction enzyme A